MITAIVEAIPRDDLMEVLNGILSSISQLIQAGVDLLVALVSLKSTNHYYHHCGSDHPQSFQVCVNALMGKH